MVPYRDEYAAMLAAGNLLMKTQGTEAMQLTYHSKAQNQQGAEQIEVRGRTLMSWLERRVILNQIISSGMTGQQIVRQLLNQNAIAPSDSLRRFPLTALYARDDYADTPISDYKSEEHAALVDGVEGILATSDLGLRVITDPRAPLHQFDIFRGLDLTADQNAREPCIFSTEFDTVSTHTYTHSTDAYRNVAYVFGADKTITVGATLAGFDRREIAVEAGDISKKYTNESNVEVTLTDAQLANMLNQRGNEELKKTLEELTFEGLLNPVAQMRFGRDFDIGDRVTFKNNKWGVSLNVRITASTETYQGNKTEISATFGEGVPSLKTAIRQMAKGR